MIRIQSFLPLWLRFNPWSRNWDTMSSCCMLQLKKKKKKRSTLWPGFVPLKAENKLPMQRHPPCTRKVEAIFVTSDRDFRAKRLYKQNCHFFITLLPQAQTFLSCQFFTDLLFLYLKGIKSACFGHFLGSFIIKATVCVCVNVYIKNYINFVFLLLISFITRDVSQEPGKVKSLLPPS